jgi:energy-coupling factor transporter ATP-binding protein EcfA2
VRELENRYLPGFTDFLDRRLRYWFSGYGRHYREFILRSHRRIDHKGLPTTGFYTPELDEVFVDVGLAMRAPGQVSTDLLTRVPSSVADRRSIHDFLGRRDPEILAVVGGPGTGKTTLLRHAARVVCRQQGRRVRKVPILLYLRDHVSALAADPTVTLPDLLHQTLDQQVPLPRHDWFNVQLRRGRCVVLLDGLDEIAKLEDRRLIADWVERLTTAYSKNHFVITSRPQGYNQTRIAGATVLQVRALTDDQVMRFVMNWYRAVESSALRDTGEDSQLVAGPKAEDLLRRLRGAPNLYDLTINPLLLTMIANVHRYRGALPGSRADLYGEICQVMLWRRQEAKKLRIDMSGEKKEVILRGLAFAMMQRRVRDLPYAELIQELTTPLRRTAREIQVEDFLADVSSNGLLVERESGIYSFTHLTFQEYLTSAYIRDKGLQETLIKVVDDVWWRETTLLYAARADVDPIVRACLASTSVTALLLAFDCADQAGEVAPELEDQLDILLDSAFDPDIAVDKRRLMAGVLVARHMRHVRQLNSKIRICPDPIPEELYWLFMQDHSGYRPDGPNEIERRGQSPVTGVRASQAFAFTAWANSVVGGEVAFRLPTEPEAQELELQKEFWLTRNTRHGAPLYQKVWSPNSEDQLEITKDDVANAIARDFENAPQTLCQMLLVRGVSVVRLLNRLLAEGKPQSTVIDYLYHDLENLMVHTRAMTEEAHYLPLTLAKNLSEFVIQERDKSSTSLDHLEAALRVVRDAVAAPSFDTATVLDTALGVNVRRALSVAFRWPPGWSDRASWLIDHMESMLDVAMGSALSRTVAFALSNASPHSQTWADDITRAFNSLIDLQSLQEELHPDAVKLALSDPSYVEMFGQFTSSQQSWCSDVARRLERNALELAQGDQSLTIDNDNVSAVRLAALCLAVEAKIPSPKLADLYRQIALGITLLERRNTESNAAREQIILATT